MTHTDEHEHAEGMAAHDEVAEDSGVETDVESVDSSELTMDQLQEQLQASQRLAEERWDQYLRARADLENERKRAARELENARKFATTELLEALLPVKDSLELGLAAADGSDAAAVSEGVRLTLKTFDSVLASHGVEEVDAEGVAFDPELHEAIAVEPSEEHPPDTVLRVHQKGYLLHGRLIRPARVTVSQEA